MLTKDIATPVKKQKKGGQTVFWWILWIVLTIGSFFVAAAFWTPFVAKHFGSIHQTRTSVIWISLVFGSWMLMLLPLIIVMYQKVDKAYEDARIRREQAAARFRTAAVDKSKRLLSSTLADKLKNWPEIISGGHLVTVILKDGRKIPHVFIQNGQEILGVYDFTELSFEGRDITDVEDTEWEHLPRFSPTQWLRLDGVSLPD